MALHGAGRGEVGFPHDGCIERGGDCVSADGRKLVIPRTVDLEWVGGWVVVLTEG